MSNRHYTGLTQAGEYSDAIRFLFDRVNYERATDTPYTKNHYRLTRMRRLLGMLHDPHLRCPVIHVAGTKGKGSVVWMLSEALRMSGCRVGRYTSPHLTRIEERFVVDAKMPTESEMVSLIDQLREAAAMLERVTGESPTFFELTTALAWLYFAKKETEIAVVEVGLGGRLDSTNVCAPLLTIITTIGMDHQKQLGDSLTQIAAEKAGIIKDHVPLVCGVIQQEPSKVIEDVANAHAAPTRWLKRDFCYRWIPPSDEEITGLFCYEADPRVFRYPTSLANLSLKSLGEHQALNASLVCAACDWLRELEMPVSSKATELALSSTQIPARLEVLSEHPTILLDTAHNEPSIRALVATIRESFPNRHPKSLLFSVSSDKDYRAMLSLLVNEFQEIVCTQFTTNPRAVDPCELLKCAEACIRDRHHQLDGSRPRLSVIPCPEQALSSIKARLPKSGMLCIAGSFFLAAELIEHLRGSE